MNMYLSRTKTYLQNAKTELNNVINILDECVVIDNDVYQKNEVTKIKKDCNTQLNNLVNYIIPEDRRSDDEWHILI